MTQVLTLRVSDELMAAIESEAKVREVSKTETAVKLISDRLGPEVPEQVQGMEVLRLSTSQIACMDQLAERAEVTRIELMRRWLSERLNREFVDNRNRLLQDAGAKKLKA
jgi:predicted transcriptional regulator